MHIFAASLPNLRRRAARGGSVGRVYRVGNAHLIPVRPTSDLRSYARYSQRFRRIHRCFAAFRGRFAGVSRAFRGRFAGVSRRFAAFRGRFAQFASLQIDSHTSRTIHSFALFRTLSQNSPKFRKVCVHFAKFRLVSQRISQEIRADSQPFRTVSRRFAALTRCESV
jgi:hypothetical protein